MKVIIDYKLLTSSGQGNVIANDECFNSLLEGIKLEVTRRTLLACKNRINIELFFHVENVKTDSCFVVIGFRQAVRLDFRQRLYVDRHR